MVFREVGQYLLEVLLPCLFKEISVIVNIDLVMVTFNAYGPFGATCSFMHQVVVTSRIMEHKDLLARSYQELPC